MDIRKLQRAIVDGLEDVKAQHIVVFDTEALSPLFERVIIASGTSNRQTKALASSVRETVKARGLQVLRTEGEASGEWIIVDCGAAVAHIMQPAIRDYYHLEEIWGGKPVRMKIGATGKPGRTPAKKAAAAQPATRKAAAAKPAATTADAGKAAGKPPAPKKPAATKPAAKAAARPAGAKKAAPKKPAAKVAAGAAATRRAAPKRPPAKAGTAASAAATKTPARRRAARG
ncbi:MAG: ribosome silencing factor [Burkholderiales bacterium]|nr:ribosome silencing factor [Burkholderiales bacterium]